MQNKRGRAVITARVSGKRLECKVTVKAKKKRVAPVPTAPGTTAPSVQGTPTATTPGATASSAPGTEPSTEPGTPNSPNPSEMPFVSMAPYESGTPEMPVLSADSGVYADAFGLKIASQPGTEIHYTTDGSIPTTFSARYEAEISVTCRNGEANVLSSAENVKKMNIAGNGYDYVPATSEVAKCTVIRAASFSPSGESSPVVTRSYFVGNDVKTKYGGATILSLVMDPKDLLDYESGIYVLGKLYDEWKDTAEGKSAISRGEYHNFVGNYTQSGEDWERTGVIDYIDADNEHLEFSAPVGIRLHGGASRMYGQKSFNFYLREEYGMKNLKYPLIPGDVDADGKQIKKYKSFMLRNGGNDTEYTKIRDIFNQNQVRDCDFAIQAATPCVLFLNGEYWGLYNLTEKYSDNSLEENYGVDKDNIVVIKEGEVDEGEDEDIALYEELLGYADKDFTDEAVYTVFCESMDIESFADYYATEIYIANKDWGPRKNYQLWRARTPEEGNEYADGKWRYILYDTEFSMGLYGSTNASTDSFNSALEGDKLFAAVMKNAGFRELFTTTIKRIGSVNFDYTACSEKLTEYTELYKPLMQDYYVRFYGPKTWLKGSFDSNVKTMKDFLRDRYSKIVSYVEAYEEKTD